MNEEGFFAKRQEEEGHVEYVPDYLESDEDRLQPVVEEVDPEPAEVVSEYREPTPWPKVLGKYGKLGVKSSDARVYDRGPAVETLLSAMGWNGDTFTEELAEEVKQIQSEHRLPVTGRVDKATWHVIVNG